MAATQTKGDSATTPLSPMEKSAQSDTEVRPEVATKANGGNQWIRWVTAWGTLILHSGVCLAIALAIALAVDGYHALDDQSATHAQYIDGRLILRVSDITTLVSAALVIVKLLVSWWTTLAVYACTHHLFPGTSSSTAYTAVVTEDSGTGGEHGHGDEEAKDIESKKNFLDRWKLPPWFQPPIHLPVGASQWTMTFALVLGAVQTLISPLLSGAINWTSIVVPMNQTTVSVAAVSPQANFSSGWYWYNYYAYNNQSDSSLYGLSKRSYLRLAEGYAGLAWSDANTLSTNGSSLTGNGCRHVVTGNNAVGPNSTLLNAVLPCIKVHGIDWYNTTVEPSRTQTNYVLDAHWLSLIDDDIFFYYDPGVAVAYDPNTPYNTSQSASVKPEPLLFTGQQTIWVFLQRQPWQHPPCHNMDPTIFGNIDSLPYYNYSTGDPTNSNCYFFGLINYTAGVTTSPRSTYITNRVVEDQTPIDEVVFEANPWVQQAQWALPDLMTQIALMNFSLLPTYDNLDGYIEALLRQAYLASWDMYHDSFDEDQRSLAYTAHPSTSRQVADVSLARVYGWLAICLLMTCSSIFLLSGVLNGSDLQLPKDKYEEEKEEGKSSGKDIAKELYSGLFSSWVSACFGGIKAKLT